MPDHPSAAYNIPLVNITQEMARQVTIDREPGQDLGHPNMLLLEDQRAIICVHPKGHGQGGIVMKRNPDGGKIWSERLPTLASWATSTEIPAIYRTVDVEGTRRLALFSGLYSIRMSVS